MRYCGGVINNIDKRMTFNTSQILFDYEDPTIQTRVNHKKASIASVHAGAAIPSDYYSAITTSDQNYKKVVDVTGPIALRELSIKISLVGGRSNYEIGYKGIVRLRINDAIYNFAYAVDISKNIDSWAYWTVGFSKNKSLPDTTKFPNGSVKLAQKEEAISTLVGIPGDIYLRNGFAVWGYIYGCGADLRTPSSGVKIEVSYDYTILEE